jgi:heat shock protein HtpX
MFFAIDRNLPIQLSGPHASTNLLQSALLLGALAALLAVAAWPALGLAAIVPALLAVAGIVALAILVPPGTLMWLYGARAGDPRALQQAEALAAVLAQRAGLARAPVLYVIPSTLLSVFSLGTPDRSAIAVTEGLLRRLTMREIAAVLAHEIGHVRRGDLFALGIADLVTRFAQALYYLGLALAVLNVFRLLTGYEHVAWLTVALLVLAPALLNLLQLQLSRKREIGADREGALLTGDPLGLASAISRLESSTGSPADDLKPPVPARRVPLPSLLRCLPPDEERIARLRALDAPPMPPLDIEDGPRISLVGVGPIQMRPRYRWPGVWF